MSRRRDRQDRSAALLASPLAVCAPRCSRPGSRRSQISYSLGLNVTAPSRAGRLGSLDRSRRSPHPARRVVLVPLPIARPNWPGVWTRHAVTP
jgi:hypothetical protein